MPGQKRYSRKVFIMLRKRSYLQESVSANVQNNRERVMDQLNRGVISADEANVQMVLDERFRMVVHRLPREIRKALNDAVKNKKLGHLKKDGLKPEVYYHPNFKYLAIEARNKIAKEKVASIQKVFVPHKDDFGF